MVHQIQFVDVVPRLAVESSIVLEFSGGHDVGILKMSLGRSIISAGRP